MSIIEFAGTVLTATVVPSESTNVIVYSSLAIDTNLASRSPTT